MSYDLVITVGFLVSIIFFTSKILENYFDFVLRFQSLRNKRNHTFVDRRPRIEVPTKQYWDVECEVIDVDSRQPINRKREIKKIINRVDFLQEEMKMREFDKVRRKR